MNLNDNHINPLNTTLADTLAGCNNILEELEKMLSIQDGKICNYECTNEMLVFISKNQSKIIKYAEYKLKKEVSNENTNKRRD